MRAELAGLSETGTPAATARADTARVEGTAPWISVACKADFCMPEPVEEVA